MKRALLKRHLTDIRTLGLTAIALSFSSALAGTTAIAAPEVGTTKTVTTPERNLKGTTNADSPSPTASSERAQAEERAPAGFILVEETVFLDMHRLPLTFISEAKTELDKKNFGAASSNLRSAARAFEFNARQMNVSDSKAHLAAAKSILEDLATQVESQAPTEMSVANSKLAQALYHKAEAHRLMARSAWTDNRYRMTGHDIRIGSESIEQAMMVSGRLNSKGSGATLQNLDSLKKVGAKLVAGSGWTRAEVDRAMSQYNTVTRTLAQNVLPVFRGSNGTESATTIREEQPNFKSKGD